ncbi:hypothetical protein WDH52_24300 [Streptomyces sp. TRM70308]|uniref:hypothetical protein n=1 Tax=Streptomyces sp. TRM70308 TaxID=3131932 RepID=UPI003CFD19DB
MRQTTQRASVLVVLALLAGCSSGEAGNSSPDQASASATEAKLKDQADRDLAIGEAYRYGDGLTFTVDRVEQVTPGPDDEQPAVGETAFRVHVTVANERQQPFDLAELAYNTYDAGTGESARTLFIEAGARPAIGKVEAGNESKFTGEYATVGRNIEFALIRSAEPPVELGDGPVWAGSIDD